MIDCVGSLALGTCHWKTQPASLLERQSEQSDCDDAFVLDKAKPPYSKANHHHLVVVKKNRRDDGRDRESNYSSTKQVFLCCCW